MNTFGFIGCGNMGGALASAIAKTVEGEQVVLCDASAEKAQALSKNLGACAKNAKVVASECAYIFLGVKPQSFAELFDEIRPILQAREDAFVLISMAAGITIKTVEQYVGKPCRVIRIMPNTPAAVGEGMILYDANAWVTDEQLATFRNALSAAGCLDRLDEDKIDAASALSGCGPAFVYLFAEALADGAVECGLSREKAMLYASQTLAGAAKLLLTSGKHPGELKDAVCSPGGTTIAGVHALEDGAFRASVMGAVNAAYEKTLKLKK